MIAIVAAVVRSRRGRPQSRLAHRLDAFAALGESPRTSGVLSAWAAGSIAARVAAATAVAAAFGVRSPLLAGLVIVPALELAGTLPLTPTTAVSPTARRPWPCKPRARI